MNIPGRQSHRARDAAAQTKVTIRVLTADSSCKGCWCHHTGTLMPSQASSPAQDITDNLQTCCISWGLWVLAPPTKFSNLSPGKTLGILQMSCFWVSSSGMGTSDQRSSGKNTLWAKLLRSGQKWAKARSPSPCVVPAYCQTGIQA